MSAANPTALSLNARATKLVEAMVVDATTLQIGVCRGAGGEVLVDCGYQQPGSLEAGRQLALICLGGLGEVALHAPGAEPTWRLSVRTDQPVLACLGSQYAGWHLSAEDGTLLMGSGPARTLAQQEPIFDDIAHRERADRAILVLEGDRQPGSDAVGEVAEACCLPRDRLTLLHATTGSLVGAVQIAARVIECALQKARALHLDLAAIVEAKGIAPVAPPHPDLRKAMGRSNDAIIYGGHVHLLVDGPDEVARSFAHALPSHTATDWGRSFAEVYAEAEGDFARIDPSLFSPAEVTATARDSGRSFAAGRRDPERLRKLLNAG